MLSEKKKAATIMYLILILISFCIITLLYFYEKKYDNANDVILFIYLKNLMFGIFTGFFVGFVLTIYEYKQQIYFDFYTYIQQTKDCIRDIEGNGISNNYDFCYFRIVEYNDLVNKTFVVRKLRKNNNIIISLINEIKSSFSKLYKKIEILKNEYGLMSIKNKEYEETNISMNKALIAIYHDESMREQYNADLAQLEEDKKNIEKDIILIKNKTECLWSEISSDLSTIEKTTEQLYEIINSTKKVFII